MYYLIITQVLNLVSKELDPYIQDKLTPHLGGLHWINVLQQLDITRGKSIDSWEYRPSDLAIQLRMLTERLGNLGYPFDSHDRNRTCSTYGSVLRLIRNRWAHNDDFQAFDALQTIEMSHSLLTHIGSEKSVAVLSEIRTKLLDSLGEPKKNAPEHEDNNQNDQDVPTSDPGEEENRSSTKNDVTDEYGEWTQIIVGEQSELDSLRTVRTRELVRSLIEDIVDVEGPVNPERVARLIGRAFGFSRLAKSRVTQITRQYQAAQIHVDEYGYLWPTNINPKTWSAFRPLGRRDFLEISPHELSNAISELCTTNGNQLSPEEVRKNLLSLYGRARETKDVKKHLEMALTNHKSK